MTFEIFEGTPEALVAYLIALAPTTVEVSPTHQKGKYLIIHT